MEGMSTNAGIQRCVTCGSRVTVHASDEGTCSYEALDDADVTRLLAEVEQLREIVQIVKRRRAQFSHDVGRNDEECRLDELLRAVRG